MIKYPGITALPYFQGQPKNSLYPPIGTQSAHKFFKSAEKKSDTRLYSEIKAPELKPITEAEFLSTDLKETQEKDPSIIQLKKRLNVHKSLLMGVQAVAVVIAIGNPAFAPVVPFINSFAGPIIERITDKITDTKLGDILSKVTEGVTSFINKLPLIGKKEKPTFAGNSQNTKQAQKGSWVFQKIQEAVQTYRARQASMPVQNSALLLTKDIHEALARYIQTEGTQQEQQQLEFIQQIQSDIQSLSNSIPESATRFGELPIATQRNLFSVVYKALTSEIEPLITWGKEVAQDLQVSDDRVKLIIDSNKGRRNK